MTSEWAVNMAADSRTYGLTPVNVPLTHISADTSASCALQHPGQRYKTGSFHCSLLCMLCKSSHYHLIRRMQRTCSRHVSPNTVFGQRLAFRMTALLPASAREWHAKQFHMIASYWCKLQAWLLQIREGHAGLWVNIKCCNYSVTITVIVA